MIYGTGSSGILLLSFSHRCHQYAAYSLTPADVWRVVWTVFQKYWPGRGHSSIVNLYITIFTGLAVELTDYRPPIGAEEEGASVIHTSLVAVLCGAVLMVVGEVWLDHCCGGWIPQENIILPGPPVSANLPAGRHIQNGV